MRLITLPFISDQLDKSRHYEVIIKNVHFLLVKEVFMRRNRTDQATFTDVALFEMISG